MRRFLSLMMVMFSVFLMNHAIAVNNISPKNGAKYVPGMLLIKFENTGESIQSTNAFTEAVRTVHAKRAEPLFEDGGKLNRQRGGYDLSGIYRFYVNESADIEALCRKLGQQPGVVYAEPVHIFPIERLVTPNDPQYSQQSYLPQIKAGQAWDVMIGDSSVIVAIMDSGVDWDHPDLAENIWRNPKEVLDGLDNDGNGKVDDIRGWDWVTGISDVAAGEDGDVEDNNPMDFDGHGTHLAGIVAAATNNAIGIASITWRCKIMPLRVGWRAKDGLGYIRMDWLAKALRYAADKGASVANISTGSNQTVVEAARYAKAAGMVITKSAGNANNEEADPLELEPWIVTASAVDDRDLKASYSTYGVWVKLAAPGGDLSRGRPGILSTYFNNTYASLQGTSFSAPISAGIAALIKSQHPDWGPIQIVRQLVLTADYIDDINPQYAGKLGAGRANAYRALTETNPPELAPKIRLLQAGAILDANGDHLFERGETGKAEGKFTYRNYSVSPGFNVKFYITSLDTDLTILNGVYDFGYFPADTIIQIPISFTYKINQNARGKMVDLSLGWKADGGYSWIDTTFKIIVGKLPILIVDDDSDDDDVTFTLSEKFYTNILDRMKVNYALWDRYQLGKLDVNSITNFPIVIWLTAWCFPSLDVDDQQAIARLLDNGGNLFISGQDIGWDFNDPGGFGYRQRDFYRKYLHAIYYSDDSPVQQIIGITGDPIGDGLKFSAWQPGLPEDNQYPDEIEPIDGATPVFEYAGGLNHKFGIKYQGDHKVVYFGMGLEAIDSQENTPPDRISSIRTEVLRRVLQWLNFVDHTPIKDIENLTEPITVTARISNSAVTSDLIGMELHWRKQGESAFNIVPMTRDNNLIYSAQIPNPGQQAIIEYFLKAVNSYYDWTSPSMVPTDLYRFKIGPDVIAPTFSHLPLKSTFTEKQPRAVSVAVRDNIAVDPNSVFIHYQTKAITDSSKLELESSGERFVGYLPARFAYGDTVRYYFSARDLASTPNLGRSQSYWYVLGIDDFESGLDYWTVSPDGWGLDMAKPYSGLYSINDSPNQSPYPNNRDVSISTATGFDLSTANTAALKFYTRIFLETNRDFGYIEVSNDGGKSWNSVGKPISGFYGVWAAQTVSLKAYCGPGNKDVRLRFRMVSDDHQGPPVPGWFIDDVQVIEGLDVTEVLQAKDNTVPSQYVLYQNYPNPFNPTTTIRFDLPRAGKITLKIFNMNGESVRTLIQSQMQPGSYTVQWDSKDDSGNSVASGLYFYQLSAEHFSATRKLLLLK